MDRERYSDRLSDHGSKAMNSNFMKNLVEDVVESKEQKPDKAFQVGFAVGMLAVAVGTFAVEAFVFSAVATLLGWPLTFMQGAGIAALFELVVVRLKNGQ